MQYPVLLYSLPDFSFINRTATCDRIATTIANKVLTSTPQIIFIDSGVEDYQFLAGRILSGIEVVILDRDRDGIEQITEVLRQKDNFTSIHIVSHGSSGCLDLGNSQLSLNTLNKYQSDLKIWANQSSIVLYGCNVAEAKKGKKFIDRLQLLTQSRIHASSTKVGSPALGGNWNLDYTKNSHKTPEEPQNWIVPFKQNVLETYSGVFAFTDVSLTTFDGTGIFDDDSNPGNDENNNNGIIRTHDTLTLNVAYETNATGAINPVLTSTLPDGLVWDNLPAWANSGISTISADKKTLTAYLIEDITVSEIGSLPLTARALGGQQGTPLNGVSVEINSDANEALVTDPKDFTLSSAPNMDIRLLSPTFRGRFSDPNGVDGVVYSYGIGVLESLNNHE